jgi:hypothetical protein
MRPASPVRGSRRAAAGHRRALLRKALPSAEDTLPSPTRPPPPARPESPPPARPEDCAGAVAADSHSSESCGPGNGVSDGWAPSVGAAVATTPCMRRASERRVL